MLDDANDIETGDHNLLNEDDEDKQIIENIKIEEDNYLTNDSIFFR